MTAKESGHAHARRRNVEAHGVSDYRHIFSVASHDDYTVKERINIWRGKYDKTCCYELQKEYFDFLQAPETYFFTFENSAHSPLFEEPGQTAEIIKLIKEKEKQ